MSHVAAKKISSKGDDSWSTYFYNHFLGFHRHRYVRRVFCLLIVAHIVFVLLPTSSLTVPLPLTELSSFVLDCLWRLWPFPTVTVLSDEGYLPLKNLVLKGIEISVLCLYALDLLPKISHWHRPLWWKIANVLVVTAMVAQVPLSFVGYLQLGVDRTSLGLRVTSMGLSFLLLCEIMTIKEQAREQQALRSAAKRPISAAQQLWNSSGPVRPYGIYTWEDVTKHDKPEDCWVVIHGKVYDLTEWVPLHPGGSVIYDGAGGDCTSMWESYHPLYVTNKGVPSRFLVGEVKDYTDFYNWEGDFYTVLKKRVEAIIPPSKRRDDIRMLRKAVFIIACYVLSYVILVKYFTWWSVMLMAFCGSQIGVNIMHDGNHGAFTSDRTICWWAGYSLDLVGSSSVVYRRSHNFGHHGCVNHFELDSAFETTYPYFRLHKFLPLQWFHKYQHVYAWFFYAIVTYADFFGAFEAISWMSNYPIRKGYIEPREIRKLWMTKAFMLCHQLVIPGLLHGWGWSFLYLQLYLMCFSYGYTLFFAVNHWTTEAARVDNSTTGANNWAVLQVTNSSNFAIDSPLWTWLSGGLNYQIEHHLFPGIVHTRYPEIRPIVEKTCEEYGIRYFSFPSFWAALRSHYDLLKELSTEPQPANAPLMASAQAQKSKVL
eukprot:GILK01002117.1.p1 GENE.GILK01002117.1~~GILK01002117.1.p1  ORF type:complete len:685 (+),score=76.20 GILK01002117.1:99-2057(+)